MSITWTKLKYLIFSLVQKPCKNLLNKIKSSSSSVISWLGVTRLEKSKNKLLLLQLKKAKQLRILHPPNRKANKNKQLDQTRVKKNNQINKFNKYKNPLSILSTKMEIMQIEFLSPNTAILNKLKRKSFLSRNKMSKLQLFAQELSMDAVKTLFISYSKQLGFNSLKNYLIQAMEIIKFPLFISKIS